MSAGQYRYRIRIEAPTRTVNPDGQTVTVWPSEHDAPFLALWANYFISSGDQGEHHKQQQTQVNAIFRVRSTPAARSVTPGMRVRFRGQIYEIATAEDIDGRNREVVIQTTGTRAA